MEFGKFMDPIADKLLVLSAFVSFVQLELVPAWMMVIVFARELVITAIRMYVVSSKNVVIAAEKFGKNKTGWHIATIITILVIIAFQDYVNMYIHPWATFFIQNGGDAGEKFVAFVRWVPWGMMSVCVAWSIWSGWDFYEQNKNTLVGIKD
jgi:CDP-diacylglycerol--glycerol-3-phosphate 3-phosphatidyltransferase